MATIDDRAIEEIEISGIVEGDEEQCDQIKQASEEE